MGLFARMGDAAKSVAKDVSGVSAVQSLTSGGAPKGDLRAFAEQRGLAFHGSDAPAGYQDSVGFDDVYNTVEGVLPGGRYGLAVHQHYLESDGRGFEHRERVWHQITRVIVPVSAGIGSIQRMKVRAYDLSDPEVGWAQVPPDRYGITGRHLYFGANADRPAIDAVLHAAAPWLAVAESTGPFDDEDLAFSYGCLRVATQGYLDDTALDAACEAACAVANALEEASVALRPARPFTEMLDGPCWVNIEEGRAPQPANPVAVAGSQGLESAPSQPWLAMWQVLAQSMPSMNVVEDSLQFHRAFPWLPAPGQAVFVFAGTLPGSEIAGRFALLTDSAHDGGKVAGLFHRNSGVNVVMMRAKDGARTQDPYEQGADLQAAIKEGVVSIWRARTDPQGDPTSGMNDFIAAAVALARSRSWVE
ncbi:MAG: hypothetical protein WAL70_16060 [Aeromicrobium sp.]